MKGMIVAEKLNVAMSEVKEHLGIVDKHTMLRSAGS
jgi:hypothetical protein